MYFYDSWNLQRIQNGRPMNQVTRIKMATQCGPRTLSLLGMQFKNFGAENVEIVLANE